MTEASKHKHARRRAPKPSPLAWLRTTPGAVVAGFLALVAVVVVVLLVVGGDDDPAASGDGPVGAAPKTYGASWKTADGHSYRLTVTPFADRVSAAAPSGCVAAAGPGRTNLRFTVRVDNRGSEPAPVPDLGFAATVKQRTGVVASSLSFAKGSRLIDLSPQAGVRRCADASRLGERSGAVIAPGSAATFTGLIGGVRTPVGPGLALIVRYQQKDAGSSSGSAPAEVRVRYPDLSRTAS